MPADAGCTRTVAALGVRPFDTIYRSDPSRSISTSS